MKKITPIRRGTINSKYHAVSFEAYGNPKGIPWMFCHGGPGFFCTPDNLKYFDLKKHFVILFDQRGSGKSQPSSQLKDNTTFHLVEDMTSILNYFKLDKINLMGGSWGSTLALVYAIKNPARVSSLVVRGIFLGRKKDVWDIYKPSKKWSKNQKEKFDLTLGVLIKKFKIKNILSDGLKILKKKNNSKKDQEKALEFAKLWAAYEDLICQEGWKILDFDQEYLKMAQDISMIEIHYFNNDCFLPKNYILKNLYLIDHIKTTIIQGSRDMVCPKSQAEALHRGLSKSKLVLDPVGGHSSSAFMKKEMKKAVAQVKKP